MPLKLKPGGDDERSEAALALAEAVGHELTLPRGRELSERCRYAMLFGE